jgi:hypothetical protein
VADAATSTAPRAAGANSNAPIDAETIRHSYETVLRASRPIPGDDRARLAALLRGHVQLLVPELAEVEPRMRGEQRRTTCHVLARNRHMPADRIATSPEDIWDLAIQCRALLTLHENPGPLRAGPVSGGRS